MSLFEFVILIETFFNVFKTFNLQLTPTYRTYFLPKIETHRQRFIHRHNFQSTFENNYL